MKSITTTKNAMLIAGGVISILSLIFNWLIIDSYDQKYNELSSRKDSLTVRNIDGFRFYDRSINADFHRSYYAIEVDKLAKGNSDSDLDDYVGLLSNYYSSAAKSTIFMMASSKGYIDRNDDIYNFITQFDSDVSTNMKRNLSPTYLEYLDSVSLFFLDSLNTHYASTIVEKSHERNEKITKIKEDLNSVKQKKNRMRFLAFTFQIVGLILIIVKDLTESKKKGR